MIVSICWVFRNWFLERGCKTLVPCNHKIVGLTTNHKGTTKLNNLGGLMCQSKICFLLPSVNNMINYCQADGLGR